MDATLEAILAEIDEESLVELLTEAVQQYSPSFAEEPAMEVFTARLERAGLSYLRQPVAPRESGDSRANLIVELGPRPARLMWVGHVDTVPAVGEEEPGLRQEGDLLYGLGTSDMKSGCAAVLEALIALRRSGVVLREGLRVALVVGEEEYGDGAEALLREYMAPLTVIGEPTGLAACPDHFGYYECRLHSRGKRVHAALPELGANAIHAMLAWLTDILEEGRRLPFAEMLAVNPRQITGGADLFVVAEHCEAALDVHVPPGVGREPVGELIERARRQALATHAGCTLEFEEVHWAPGYANEPDAAALEPLRRAYAQIGLPWSPLAFRSHSDGSLFYQRGSVPLICGPGRLEVAHTRGEHVSLTEVKRAARLYAAMFYEACVATSVGRAPSPTS
jgi:acetylornithine deacetylase